MKKKLLAFVLSAMMLTESVLPVVAADDVDVVVSENAAEEVTEDAVAEEEAATEETAAEEQSEEAVVEETAEIEATEAEETAAEEQEAEVPYEVISDSEVLMGPVMVIIGDESEDVADEESEDVSVNGEHIKVGNRKEININNAGSIEIEGKTYNVYAKGSYSSYISYRARKIKPDVDLSATINNSSLYDIARALTTTGSYTNDVITWKFPAKKNKNAGTEACFNVKAAVNTNVAKSLGIKGKSLSKLKKAVKMLNKVSMKKDAKYYFEIGKINVSVLMAKNADQTDDLFAWGTYSKSWFSATFSSLKSVWVRLEPDQPKTVDEYSYKSWTKIKKSDFKITYDRDFHLQGVYSTLVKVTLTPKDNKNFTGGPIYILFYKNKSGL